ncbi:MAG: tRNA-dihydrouridine synthase family protein [Myxococcales bacterium]|nr:tRNA-dihydrouridine synthase family protein [Myxococcales bacterium]
MHLVPVQTTDGWVLTTGVPHQPRFALAPMEGVSDATARNILSALGGMDLCVTEFIRVTNQPVSYKVLRKLCPELDQGGRTHAGVPVLVQLLGSDEKAMAETARTAVQMGAPGIDINFGCPARRVNGHDGGAAILRTPSRIEQLVKTIRRAVPTQIPVSAKIRLGWSEPSDVIDITRAAEAGGASFVTIHGRTKTQLYKPSADWRSIGMARESVSVPIVANGDLYTPEDVRRCQAESGCSAFMFGRGAFRIPNLFRWVRRLDAHAWTPDQVALLLRQFVNEMAHQANQNRPDRVILARLKQWLRYLAEPCPVMAACFDELKRQQSLTLAVSVLDSHFPVRAKSCGYSTIAGRTQTLPVLL